MKRRFLGALALCSLFLVGCGGANILKTETSAANNGNRLFLEVGYERSYKVGKDVKFYVNYAHEKVMEKEIPYYVGIVTTKNKNIATSSIYSLPLDFSTSEEFNAKDIKSSQVIPGVVAYSATYNTKMEAVTIDWSCFEEGRNTFSLALIPGGTQIIEDVALSKTIPSVLFTYTLENDVLTIQ